MKPGEIKRAMERRRFAPGHRGPVMASLPPSSLKGVCKHKVCLLCPGAKLLVCYICVLLRLFLIWCNFQHAVIYQEKPHGSFFFFFFLWWWWCWGNSLLAHPGRCGRSSKDKQNSMNIMLTWWEFNWKKLWKLFLADSKKIWCLKVTWQSEEGFFFF